MTERTNVRRMAKAVTIIMFLCMVASVAVLGYKMFWPQYKVDQTKWYGVHWHPQWNQSDFEALDVASEMGVEIIRLGVSWRLMEPTQDKLDEGWYMPAVDERIQYATDRGMAVLIMLGEVPYWASPDENSTANGNYDFWCPVGSEIEFANAMASLVQRYAENDLVVAFEVWNEPNLDYFWCQAPNAREYTTLLNATYEAVKTADPNAIVLGGSLAGADIIYLKQMYIYKARFDALALHPYSGTSSPTECLNARWAFACGVENIHEEMVANGDASNIWFTELGWANFEGDGGVTAEQQALYFKQAVDVMATADWDYVPVVIWYALVDRPEEADNREGYFGLVNPEMTPKPVADEFPLHPTPTPNS